MIYAISNIAWTYEERLAAYDLMEAAGFSGLEIAPALFFPFVDNHFRPDNGTITAALAEIRLRGLSIVSMQSLLFGVEGAHLFGNDDARAAFKLGMKNAINLAHRLNIPNLVFGSPVQRRIPDFIKTEDAFVHAVETFRCLADHAAIAGSIISIEPNPAAYGTNFLTTLDEVELFVEKVDHPAVKLNLDLGAMHMNGTYGTVSGRISTLLPKLSHVHVSEPKLAPAPDDATELAPLLTALHAAGYKRAVSIEMIRDKNGIETLRTRIAAFMRAVDK